MSDEQRCGVCKWWGDYTDKPESKRRDCLAPLPISAKWRGVPMADTEGSNCPTFVREDGGKA